MKNLTVVLTVSLFSSIIVYSQISEYKILPADGSNNDAFGNSVSISGDYAIVGAPGDDENSHFSGSAYIFRRDGETWIEEQKLLATDITRGDQFGYSVSISGYNAIVGAARDDDNGLNSGSAYFFRRDSTSWVEEKKIIASDGAEGDLFGSSVSISEDFAIIGAQRNDGYTGAAYIFKKSEANWAEIQKLTASDGASFDIFGHSVSISGDNVIVGAPYDDDNGPGSGSAYIYTDFVVDVKNNLLEIPTAFNLSQNYPNPFNPSTTIKFSLFSSGQISLTIFNDLGEEVAELLDKELNAGSYEVDWDARGLSSGVYFYQLKTDSFVETKKMIFMK